MASVLQTHPARLAALAAGEKTFSTEQPCKAAHSSPRYTQTGICVACNDDRNAARSTGKPRGRPVKVMKARPQIVHTKNIEAAALRARPRAAFARAVDSYYLSAEARERSAHLDQKIRGLDGLTIEQPATRPAESRRRRRPTGAYHQFQKVAGR
jgi:hypothetical protein